MIDFRVNCISSGHTICWPNWHVEEEGSLFHRIYYVHSGEAIYEDNKHQFKLEHGCLYFFPIHTRYSIKHNPSSPLRCTWFHIVLSPLVLDPVIELKVNDPSVTYYILKAIEASIASDSGRSSLVFQLLKSLITALNEKLNFSVSGDERLHKVINYIHDNYSKKLTNKGLSNYIGVDRYYFIRIFKNSFGVTPQKYVLSYRINKAKGMLSTGLSVQETAEAVGFTDAKAFSRAFKKSVGISPSQYKESHYLQP